MKSASQHLINNCKFLIDILCGVKTTAISIVSTLLTFRLEWGYATVRHFSRSTPYGIEGEQTKQSADSHKIDLCICFDRVR